MNATGGDSSGNTKDKVKSNNIQVYLRVRPTNVRERLIKSHEIVEVPSSRDVVVKQTMDSRMTKKFTFDRAFGTDSQQHEVYSTVVAPLIEEVVSGYNCTVFAYGQTGTGKTYTMVGEEQPELSASWEDISNVGIVPRALNHLFDELRMMEVEYAMRVSYLELYNEELCDLLSTDDSSKIRIFDDASKKGSVIVHGLEEIPVRNKDDVYKLLAKGQERRKTAATLMNAQSSRSHTVFSILVHIKENNPDGEEMLKIGKLNLVDLAGSENISKAGNEKGIRTRETVNINQSLLTLGRVITALVERTPHIPYRESKLTRLLQESLGGRTKTSIIATISPGHKDIEETLSTLDYAHRAKNIQNKPEINQKLTKRAMLKEYNEEIERLKRDLMASRDKNGIYLAEDTYNDMQYKMESQMKELNDKVALMKALKDDLSNKQRMFEDVSNNLNICTGELVKAQQIISVKDKELKDTKRDLKQTVRQVEEKSLVIHHQKQTEELLTNQATQLIHVADIAANDAKSLLESIDRRVSVENKVQIACDNLSINLNGLVHELKLDATLLSKNHQEHTQIIIDEIMKNTKSTKQFCGELLNEWNAMKTMQEDSKKMMLRDLIEWSKRLDESTANELNEILASFNLMMDQSDQFNELTVSKIDLTVQQMNENWKSLEAKQESLKDITKLQLDSGLKLREDLQQQLDSFSERITAKIQAEHDSLAEKTAKSRQLMDERNKNLEQMKTLLDNMEKLEKNAEGNLTHIESIKDNMLLKNEDVFSHVFTVNAHIKENMEVVENTSLKQSQITQQILSDSSSQHDKHVKDLLDIKSSSSENRCQLVNQIQKDVASTKSFMDGIHKEFVAVTAAQKASIEKAHISENDLTVSVTQKLSNEKKRVDCHDATTTSYIKEILHKTVYDTEKLMTEKMLKCEDQIGSFKSYDLIKYEPSGATPARKEYQITRELAFTSPHDRIIRRLKMEQSINNSTIDLDTSCVILEDSEEDISAVMLNSTPVEIADNNQRKNLKNLEISHISEDNKENSAIVNS